MALTLTLPTPSRTLEAYTLRGTAPARPPAGVSFNRIAYSAAHVVADPLAAVDPWLTAAIDWDATIAYRRHLWSLGLGVAEAMDTAQRGMGLDWASSLELIRRSLDAAKDVPGALVASGCGTDHLDLDAVKTVDDVIRGYEEQMEAIEALGGKLIVMASRALARVAKGPADYERVYGRVLSQVRQPVVLHWLGDMFDPALKGYWGTTDLDAAMDTALGIIAAHAGKVDGIKISLLDKDKEIAMRRRLPPGVRMYTGDDFNYAELIAGDGFGAEPTHGKSDALLGIFDAIAPAASAALGELAAGNLERFHAILGPTVPLSRHIFQAPTRFYKTGVVFMAWLNGHQSHFTMVGGQQSTRSLQHLAELFRLADAANLLERPELAVARMKHLLAVHGVGRLNVAMLPDRIADVEALEALMSTPSPALIETLARVEGDLMVLGVGGKMGPTLARMAKLAGPGRRVIGVARFSEPGLREKLEAHGIECIAADLLSRKALQQLPEAPNIVFMAGRKFGSAGSEWLTWAMNAWLPGLVAERFSRSRIVAFSTACVYPFVNVHGPGAPEETPPTPPGEYANSCVARERLFEHFSHLHGTAGRLIRLSYAIDMRYGVLHDLAQKLQAGEVIDLGMGHANVIWQGDANDWALRALAHCDTPTTPLNLSGPAISIRHAAQGLADRLGVPARFTGQEAATAWLIDCSRAFALFGQPQVSLERMLDWTADWVRRGQPSLNKPTHFEARDGKY